MIIDIVLITLLIGSATGLSAITGFGTSTISIPILLNFYSLHETLLFVGILHFIGTLWKMYLFRKGATLNILLSFGLPAVIASYVGARSTFTIPQQMASSFLGGFLVVYVFFIFAVSDFKLKTSIPVMLTGGSLSGFFAGIFGMGGAIRSVFLTAHNFAAPVYLFTTNLIAALIDVVRLETYISGGMHLNPVLWLSLIASVPFSMACAWCARKVVTTIPQQHFRYVVGTFLGLAGLKLILFS